MKKTILVVLYLVFFNISTISANETPTISATAAIVTDARTGLILYEKNIHQPRYPASIAKIMTALLALEKGGRSFIVVTLEGEGSRLYTDTAALPEYAFAIPYVETKVLYSNQYIQIGSPAYRHRR